MEDRIDALERALKRHRLVTWLAVIVTTGVATWALVRGFRETMTLEKLTVEFVKVEGSITVESDRDEITMISPGNLSMFDRMAPDKWSTVVNMYGVSTKEPQ